ncbi:MAG TPA: VOC family protein [Candidatus Thermoplasmatota archaeon]
MSAVHVEAVSQVAMTVPNIDEAISFYEGKLGIRLLFKTPNMAMLACGETRILLGTPEQNTTKQPMFLYFRVEDIKTAFAGLRSDGVRVGQEPHMVGSFQGRDAWLATFFDPSGTLHHLISEVPGAANPSAAVQSARSKA